MLLCVYVRTGYDFRRLDLHKALVGEGVPEELAHSRLQSEDGLAGGRLREGHKHTCTKMAQLPFVTQHKRFDKTNGRFLSWGSMCIQTQQQPTVYK